MNYIHISNTPNKNPDIPDNHVYLDPYWGLHKLDLNTPYQFDPHHDILIKENCHSDDFLRIYLKWFNPDKAFCSHVLYMDNGTNQFILTDAAMNIEPTLSDLVKIVENAATMWRAINHLWGDDIIHVNFINYSGSFSIKNKDSITANTLATHFEINNSGEFLFTNWQLDSCLYPESRQKKYASDLIKCPDILVAPNISVGNAIYKCLMKEYDCLGFVVGGANTAVLNSRSDLDKNEKCIKILENKGL